MKITATDRKSLIRLASSMEKGSPERRAILAGLKKAGGAPRNAGEAREAFEWGGWPGKPRGFEWDMVESEGSNDLRFDWRRGSTWLRFYGGTPEAEGNIPPHFKKHLTKLGFDVY